MAQAHSLPRNNPTSCFDLYPKLTAGLGFKPEHFKHALQCSATGMWYEIHAENYMVDGGPRLAMLAALRDRYPLSIHGIGLSLAADADPDPTHLARLAQLIHHTEPFLVSEHLAWSTWHGIYYPDLLPFPRTQTSLDRLTRNIEQTQTALKRRILIENPALYLSLEHELSEAEFLAELVRRTGCGLLVDVNNAYVSAHNLNGDAATYLSALPHTAIAEIHLAGHAPDKTVSDLLLDTHGTPIAESVWHLYHALINCIGPRPTLIERDNHVPSFEVLLTERNRAAAYLQCAPVFQETEHVTG